jgi:hypothetical protein
MAACHVAHAPKQLLMNCSSHRLPYIPAPCSHIRWWRIIADEPQLQAGGFLADKEHRWFANHKWLLTGTPINATGGCAGAGRELAGVTGDWICVMVWL